ncbi:hypothetical protein [Polluticaenibacter yanchengensis]|uniref:Uncharacterized protein n=1 Tax=Polluticaenibacter yanchengensis TaxID=3014562 RepID=A0ABT4UEH1_9BACT|nr:hypothetical protein [Chitinophagaceae bacterium LY-5]
MENKQPWLYKSWMEWLFIIAPPFFCLLLIMVFPALFQNNNSMPAYWWVVLILLIDVGHVYSTLYRTYLNPQAWHKYRQPMQWIPVLSLLLFIVIHSLSSIAFWMVLAYLAVFHFIRQQYGIFQLYSRKEQHTKITGTIDIITIYAATLYPVLYWHFSGNRNFTWFVEGDFLLVNAPKILPFFTGIYITILVTYIVKEFKQKAFNLPKNMVMAGTVLSWYLGIVYFNGDMAFTLFNVVSHGIPYMALVWIYIQKENTDNNPYKNSNFYKLLFGQYGILIFVLSLMLFAYIEEGFWDGIVWKEHGSVFGAFRQLDRYIQSHSWMNILIPLLALPQITHYIIDGFIWRKNSKH